MNLNVFLWKYWYFLQFSWLQNCNIIFAIRKHSIWAGFFKFSVYVSLPNVCGLWNSPTCRFFLGSPIKQFLCKGINWIDSQGSWENVQCDTDYYVNSGRLNQNEDYNVCYTIFKQFEKFIVLTVGKSSVYIRIQSMQPIKLTRE